MFGDKTLPFTLIISRLFRVYLHNYNIIVDLEKLGTHPSFTQRWLAIPFVSSLCYWTNGMLGYYKWKLPNVFSIHFSKRLLSITMTASHNSDIDFEFELVSKYILHVRRKKWYEARWHHKMEIFSHYWPSVRGFPRSPVKSTHKGLWRGALCFLWFTSEHTVE